MGRIDRIFDAFSGIVTYAMAVVIIQVSYEYAQGVLFDLAYDETQYTALGAALERWRYTVEQIYTVLTR